LYNLIYFLKKVELNDGKEGFGNWSNIRRTTGTVTFRKAGLRIPSLVTGFIIKEACSGMENYLQFDISSLTRSDSSSFHQTLNG